MSDHVGDSIRAAREALGYSLADLAKRTYISRGHISNLEAGRYNPSPQALATLSNALGVDLSAPSRRSYPGWVPASDRVALVLTSAADGSVTVVPMDRRAFLATAATAAGTATLALPDRVTPDVVTAISDRLDWHILAGRVSDPGVVARLISADLDRIVRAAADAPKPLRRDTFALASRYAEYLGWMWQETGDLDAAMRATTYASDLAQVAGWRPMMAYTTIRRARLWQYHRPDYAADLASAVYARPATLTPGLRAMAASQAAEAYARAGRDTRARRALETAGHAWGSQHDNEPPVGPWVLASDADLAVGLWTARCDVQLGRAEEAIGPLARLVNFVDEPKAWALNGGQLAVAYARAGAVDDAVSTTRRTLDAVAVCPSATGRRELHALQPALQPWAGRDDVDQVLTALPA